MLFITTVFVQIRQFSKDCPYKREGSEIVVIGWTWNGLVGA